MKANDKKGLRKKLFVNREVQGAIVLRSMLHWCFYMCAILMSVAIWTAIGDPSQNAIKLLYQAFVYFSPAIVVSVVLLPLLIYDILKASHRVVGPIVRLQREMGKLADGHDVDPLNFRDEDHWPELAEEFNRLAAKLRAERPANSKSECSYAHQTEAIIG